MQQPQIVHGPQQEARHADQLHTLLAIMRQHRQGGMQRRKRQRLPRAARSHRGRGSLALPQVRPRFSRGQDRSTIVGFVSPRSPRCMSSLGGGDAAVPDSAYAKYREADATRPSLSQRGAVELLQLKSEADAKVREMLPLLHALLSDEPMTSDQRASATAQLRAWEREQHDAQFARGKGDTDDSGQESTAVLCGWLRKLGRRGMQWQKRWCVLNNGRLMYYTDIKVRRARRASPPTPPGAHPPLSRHPAAEPAEGGGGAARLYVPPVVAPRRCVRDHERRQAGVGQGRAPRRVRRGGRL